MTLHERLETATAALHDQFESLPFFAALREGALSRLAMLSFLRSLAIIHTVLERALAQVAIDPVSELGRLTGRKIPLLMADIELLGDLNSPSVTSAIRDSLEYAAEILVNSCDPLTLIGPLYVLEETQNGAMGVKRVVSGCFNLNEAQVSYFGCYGSATAGHWSSVRKALNSVELGDDQTDKIVQSAVQCLQRLKTICSALHPCPETGLKHHVAALNFEAGDHAMPQDPGEIRLALRAGQAAWEGYPYLEQRFGDRGRRYTSSDSCWLVALTRMPETAVTRNLDWLRAVLATRGIPSVILEGHLSAITTALAAESGETVERRTRFDPFLANLTAERQSLGGAHRLPLLVQAFERRFNRCDGRKLESAAELIASAWIDEHAGITGALAALRDWLADRRRFSAGWVATLDEFVAALDQGACPPC